LISAWRLALTGAIALMFLSLLVLPLVLGAWSAVSSLGQRQQQAAERTQGSKEGTRQGRPDSRPEDPPLNFGSVSVFAADGRPGEIPGLCDMDVIGYLRYVPGTDFRCPAGGPRPGGLIERVCQSSSGEDSATYEVTVISDGRAPGVPVISVVATDHDASDEEAAAVLGRVAGLATAGVGPGDPEA